jgi:hypothetical protein
VSTVGAQHLREPGYDSTTVYANVRKTLASARTEYAFGPTKSSRSQYAFPLMDGIGQTPSLSEVIDRIEKMREELLTIQRELEKLEPAAEKTPTLEG